MENITLNLRPTQELLYLLKELEGLKPNLNRSELLTLACNEAADLTPDEWKALAKRPLHCSETALDVKSTIQIKIDAKLWENVCESAKKAFDIKRPNYTYIVKKILQNLVDKDNASSQPAEPIKYEDFVNLNMDAKLNAIYSLLLKHAKTPFTQ